MDQIFTINSDDEISNEEISDEENEEEEEIDLTFNDGVRKCHLFVVIIMNTIW